MSGSVRSVIATRAEGEHPELLGLDPRRHSAKPKTCAEL